MKTMVRRIDKVALLGLGQFQVTHKFELEVIRRPVILNNMDQGVIRSVIKSVRVPQYSQDTAEVMLRGHRWDEPTITHTNGDWGFAAMELEASSPLRRLAVAWQNALRLGTLLRRDLTADFKLTSRRRNNSENHIYIIKNWYPTQIQTPDFTGEGQLYEITFDGKFMDLDIVSI